MLNGSGQFLFRHLKPQSPGLLDNQDAVDHLVQSLFLKAQHFEHLIIELVAVAAPVLVQQPIVCLAIGLIADDRPVDIGYLGGFAGPKAPHAPENEHQHNGEQQHLDNPAAGFFTHYIEHARPLFNWIGL